VAGTPREIAEELRRQVRERVGLPITVGVARTKFLAKVASVSAKPDGLLVVEPDGELDFLHPLPVERLWGVGPKTAAKLHGVGLFTVRDVAELSEATLVSLLGAGSGRHLHALAHNRDPRPVVVGRRRASIGSQHALGRAGVRKSPEEVDAILVALVERVTRRMRTAGRVGRTVLLRLRFDDFDRITRSHTFPHSTAHTETILDAARSLVAGVRGEIANRGLTLVGVSVGQLDDADAVQLALPFDDGAPRDVGLDDVLDRVRGKFGAAAVTRAVLLGRDSGLSMPMLPD
jgi:DNA polymerase-4